MGRVSPQNRRIPSPHPQNKENKPKDSYLKAKEGGDLDTSSSSLSLLSPSKESQIVQLDQV